MNNMRMGFPRRRVFGKPFHSTDRRARFLLEVRRVLTDAGVTLVSYRRKKGRVEPEKMVAHYGAQLF